MNMFTVSPGMMFTRIELFVGVPRISLPTKLIVWLLAGVIAPITNNVGRTTARTSTMRRNDRVDRTDTRGARPKVDSEDLMGSDSSDNGPRPNGNRWQRWRPVSPFARRGTR